MCIVCRLTQCADIVTILRLNDVRKSLGERIEHYRKLRKLSQSALASAMGVDKHTVWRWEDGRSWPEYDKLLAISKHLEIEPERLFETIGKTPAKPTVQESLAVLVEALSQKSTSAIPEAEDFDDHEMKMLRIAAQAIREQRPPQSARKKRDNHS